jgi:hypothetical protein
LKDITLSQSHKLQCREDSDSILAGSMSPTRNSDSESEFRILRFASLLDTLISTQIDTERLGREG